MANDQPQILLSKSDVDRTFSFNKSQWTVIAPQMIEPKWTLRFADHSTGTQIIAFDPSTGFTLSIRPFYAAESNRPVMVVVANYFPLGLFPELTATAESVIELTAQKELGNAYSVKVCHRKKTHFEIFDFVISEL